MYSVTESVTPEGHAAPLAVWTRNFPAAQFQKRYQWYYRDNPYNAFSYLLTDDHAGAIGAAGLSARRFVVSGESRLVGLCSDFSVDADRRFLKPALQLQRAVRKNGLARYPFIYGFPNSLAEGVMTRVGYNLLGYLRYYTCVLGGDFYRRRRPWIPKRVGRGINTAMRVWVDAVGSLLPSTPRLQELAGIDARFDSLWAGAAKTGYMAVRDALFLDWRFSRHPVDRFRVFGLVDDSDALLGYCVVAADDTRQWRVVDLLARAQPRIMPALVLALVRRAINEGAESVTVAIFGALRLRRTLRLLGFHLQAKRRPIVLAAEDRLWEGGQLRKPGSWYMTSADED